MGPWLQFIFNIGVRRGVLGGRTGPPKSQNSCPSEGWLSHAECWLRLWGGDSGLLPKKPLLRAFQWAKWACPSPYMMTVCYALLSHKPPVTEQSKTPRLVLLCCLASSLWVSKAKLLLHARLHEHAGDMEACCDGASHLPNHKAHLGRGEAGWPCPHHPQGFFETGLDRAIALGPKTRAGGRGWYWGDSPISILYRWTYPNTDYHTTCFTTPAML